MQVVTDDAISAETDQEIARLQEQMTQTYELARATQLDYSKRCRAISLREAGLIYGIEELHDHIWERGIFP
jgi:hypothetical protein